MNRSPSRINTGALSWSWPRGRRTRGGSSVLVIERLKQSWVQVPETTPSQRSVDLDVGFISRTGCGSSPPAATMFRGVAKWYRARFGTARPEVRSLSPRRRMDTGAVRARKRVRFPSDPRAGPWLAPRRYPPGVRLPSRPQVSEDSPPSGDGAFTRRSRSVRFRRPLRFPAIAQQQSTWLITAGSLGQNQLAGRWASSSTGRTLALSARC
jgi:hypothetical protein